MRALVDMLGWEPGEGKRAILQAGGRYADGPSGDRSDALVVSLIAPILLSYSVRTRGSRRTYSRSIAKLASNIAIVIMRKSACIRG